MNVDESGCLVSPEGLSCVQCNSLENSCANQNVTECPLNASVSCSSFLINASLGECGSVIHLYLGLVLGRRKRGPCKDRRVTKAALGKTWEPDRVRGRARQTRALWLLEMVAPDRHLLDLCQ